MVTPQSAITASHQLHANSPSISLEADTNLFTPRHCPGSRTLAMIVVEKKER